MKRKTRFILFMAVVLLFTLTPMAMAYQVTTTGGAGFGQWQTGSGGEFTFNTTEIWLGLYNAVAVDQNGTKPNFQTFCLEEQEYIYPNTTYSAAIGPNAIRGGVGNIGDPISVGTADLYRRFATNNWGGTGIVYNYGLGRTTSAADLQDAIWYLEGEGGSLTAAYSTYLITAYGSVLSAQGNSNGAYSVQALIMYADGHLGDLNYARQDMLVLTPIPAAVWLLGTGLVALIGIRRRKTI